jgi:hypothetical protein
MLTDCIVNANHGLHQRTKTKQSLTAISIILIHKSIDLKKKVVRPIFFCRRGLSPVFFLGIYTKINSCAFSAKWRITLTYRCTWSLLPVFDGVLVTLLLLVFCVFSFSFCMLFVISVSIFFASSLFLDFPTFRFWACLMKVIPETRCAH